MFPATAPLRDPIPHVLAPSPKTDVLPLARTDSSGRAKTSPSVSRDVTLTLTRLQVSQVKMSQVRQETMTSSVAEKLEERRFVTV